MSYKQEKLTFKPTQNVCNCDPHCLATFVCAKCREATAATSEESSPPDKSTPNGTSVISLLITAFMITKVSDHKHKRCSNIEKQTNDNQLTNNTST